MYINISIFSNIIIQNWNFGAISAKKRKSNQLDVKQTKLKFEKIPNKNKKSNKIQEKNEIDDFKGLI